MDDIEVTGVKENAKALTKASELNTVKAGTDAARDLLPFIKAETRQESGVLKGGWYVEDSAFLNMVEYAPFQEFGTVYIDPTDAIRKTIDKHEEVLTGVFEKEQERAAKQAGFGS